jgi:hypothetical protein
MQQHGHRTATLQTARFLKACSSAKKVVRREFSEKFGINFWRNIKYQMMQLKMHGF